MKSAPKDFKKVYFLHRLILKKCISLGKILQKSRIENAYTEGFSFLKANFKLKLNKVLIDYEQAAKKKD